MNQLSADMAGLSADIAESIADMAYLRQEEKQREYHLRLAQFVVHHFGEIDWQAMIACDKGPDLDLDAECDLHANCEHWLKLSAERAKEEYTEVLGLRAKVRYLNTEIRESKSDVEAEKLNAKLNEVNTLIQDRLTKMATQYNFDGNVALCDQAMSIAVRHDEWYRAEKPGDLTAFFKACRTEYNPAETSELLAFFQTKYPDA